MDFFNQSSHVSRGRTAAATHDRDIVFLNELCHCGCKRFGFQRVDSLTINIER